MAGSISKKTAAKKSTGKKTTKKKISVNTGNSNYSKGKSFFDKKDYKQAINFLKLVPENKRDANFFYMQGMSYFRLDKYTSALRDIKKAVKIEPNNSTYKRNLKAIIEVIAENEPEKLTISDLFSYYYKPGKNEVVRIFN